MNIEGLKELKDGLNNILFIALSKLTDKSARENVCNDAQKIKDIIDYEIARQSVTDEGFQKPEVADEDLQRAVLWLQTMRNDLKFLNGDSRCDKKDIKIGIENIDIIIAALWKMQPILNNIPEQLINMFAHASDSQIVNSMHEFHIKRDDARIIYAALRQMNAKSDTANRIFNAVCYAYESHEWKRSIEIITAIMEGKTDDEINRTF